MIQIRKILMRSIQNTAMVLLLMGAVCFACWHPGGAFGQEAAPDASSSEGPPQESFISIDFNDVDIEVFIKFYYLCIAWNKNIALTINTHLWR